MKQVYWSFSTVRVRWRNIQFEVKAGYIYLISMRQKEREKDKERERIYSIYSLSLREREINNKDRQRLGKNSFDLQP